ncbi:S1 RNA-binding domain-containing protein [Actinomadura harenae]|uniref:S1 RNA-binding domain-containing protein n=1 Tax=Actinomadura harenae TaxID=2483351 RepID=A0A3M2MD69_9ACTN|nr:S1 RNA-binding domain-containing protein [Actinomadura harenae]RMI46585.1 S1 RNA-binding domain-containing protein [Actinomadura harenae]
MRNGSARGDEAWLWRFLGGLRPGQVVSGVVASIESFGVFVALDDGPPHPVYPGVGFITIPELSWRRFDDATEVVSVGERIRCAFLGVDTYNGEARLSLRALSPDPFEEFARRVQVGQGVRGTVTLRVPFGVFVRVADGIEGLVHESEMADVPEAGEEVGVVVTGIDAVGRRVGLRWA